MRRVAIVAVAAAGVCASAPLAAPASGGPVNPFQCFRTDQWEGSTAASPKDIYIRVNRDIWHLGMAETCAGAMSPGKVRVETFVVSGNGFICKPSDLEMSVAPAGFSTSLPCSVSELHKLSPEEARALPRKWMP